MTVQYYLGNVTLFTVAPTPTPPVPVGPAPAWGEVALALGQMRDGILQNGWATGQLVAPGGGFCMQGSFIFRPNAVPYVEQDSPLGLAQDSPLGLAVADLLWDTIRQTLKIPLEYSAATSWNKVIHFNDHMCGSKEMALWMLETARESALRLAEAEETGAAPPEAEETPTPTPVPVTAPDYIPGQFAGLLEALGGKVLASVGT
jgi:hypothetical protein